VQFGMTKEQVREILGPPARREDDPFDHRWYWYEKNGPAEFNVNFTNQGKVQGVGRWTPD